MSIISEFILAFFCTIGFSILFSVPQVAVPYTGLTGGLGMVLYSITTDIFQSNVAGTFFGALTVGLLGELWARKRKKPATLFITPGIIPLVPGAGMYYTMLAIINKDFFLAAHKGAETFFIAAAIAVGIIISSAFSRSIKRVKFKD